MTKGHQDEHEWLETLVRDNQDMERARRIQPGRGHPYRYKQDSDWWVLAIILVFIVAGVFG